MKRKHVVLFTIITLVCIVTLVIFQMFGDEGYVGEVGGPQQAIETAPIAPVDAPAE